MKINISLRNKLILAIFIGCLIPYSLGGIYLNSYIKKGLYENSIENSNQVLSQVNELIDRSLIVDMNEEITLLASLDCVKDANNIITNYTNYNADTSEYVESIGEKKINEYFKIIKESHNTTNFIFLGTEDGGYMEYPRFLPSKSYDPRKRPWYINSIEKDDVTISEPYITDVSKEMVVSFTKKIINDNDTTGVVGISVKINDLSKSISQIKIGKSGYVLVMSANNKFIISPNNPEWILKSPDELGLIEIKQFETGTFETELEGKSCVFNTMTSQNSGWRIVTVIDKSEMLHSARLISNIFIVIYVITALCIYIIIIGISRRITRPILEISSVIDHMTDFDFSFADNSNINNYIKRKDEIGVVSKALIEMHKNYSELITQVNSFNDEIKKVDIKKDNQFIKDELTSQFTSHELEVSKSNPFYSVIASMNILLDKVYLYLGQLKTTNSEIVEKNDLLTVSEEELIAQLNEIEQQKEYINYLAFHDSLTGLPNRRRFVETATDKITANQTGAVILLDIDDFKGINDTLGHVFGDRVLEAIAERLRSIINPKVFISRFGGDEFLILLECGNNFTMLNHYMEMISGLFAEKIKVDNVDTEIRFSMGVSLFPEDSIIIDQLVMNADLAMYSVKNSGKNGYRLFDSRMMDYQIKKSKIEGILRDAIENNGFKLVYQPQVDVKTGQIFCYEALLRLKNYNLFPAEFVDIAEQNGSIISIGRIVTEKVIEQLFKWKQMGMDIKPVSINFSANQLHDSGYIQFLRELLEKYEINARYIEIEITENIFLESKQATLTFMKNLKDMEIKIAIDDFGTGYSSLNYLTFLPIDIIKLDRSLNMKFLEINNVSVMDSLISLAHSLGLVVVAEGIEILEHVNQLKAAQCDYIQGYYFSKPLEEDQIPLIHHTIYTNF